MSMILVLHIFSPRNKELRNEIQDEVNRDDGFAMDHKPFGIHVEAHPNWRDHDLIANEENSDKHPDPQGAILGMDDRDLGVK